MRRPLFLIVLAGLAAVFLMLWVTAPGIGVSPDSTIYIETARSLLKGEGFYIDGRPMTHYPPVYPLLLAVSGMSQPDILPSARLLHAFLFGVNVVLVGFCVYAITAHSFAGTAVALVFFLLCGPVLKIHSMAWSESSFFLFSLSGMIGLSAFIAKPAGWRLPAAALSFGMAAATRYVGITLIPVMLFGLLFLGDRSARQRIRDVGTAVMVSGLPLGAWLLRNMTVAETVANRSFRFHPTGWAYVRDLFLSLHGFVLPESLPEVVKWTSGLLLTAVLAAGLVVFFKHRFRRDETESAAAVFVFLSTIFCGIYIVFIFFSISFIDAHTPINDRILSPVFIFMLLVGFGVFFQWSRQLKRSSLWRIFLCAMILFTVSDMSHTISLAVDRHRHGSGYHATIWQESETIALVKSLPGSIRIYSNGPDAIRFLTGRKAQMIPKKVFTGDRRTNDRYAKRLVRMCRRCKNRQAVIVYLDHITWRWYLPTWPEIQQSCGLPVEFRLADGMVLGGGID